MTSPKPRRALLLDLDGTIADTHGLIFRCYDHAVRAHTGQAGRSEIWERCVGLPLEALLAETFRFYGHALPPDLLEEIKQSYRAHMRANDDDVKPFPGIPATLETVRQQGFRLAVVTTKHAAMTRRHLDKMGLSGLFDALITGDRCANRKPHPEPFLKALAALSILPEEAAGIGDTQHDIESARGAGMLTIAACWGTEDRAALLAADPDHLIEQPSELITLLRENDGQTPPLVWTPPGSPVAVERHPHRGEECQNR
jgi:pyrophosphatase PpaX